MDFASIARLSFANFAVNCDVQCPAFLERFRDGICFCLDPSGLLNAELASQESWVRGMVASMLSQDPTMSTPAVSGARIADMLSSTVVRRA